MHFTVTEVNLGPFSFHPRHKREMDIIRSTALLAVVGLLFKCRPELHPSLSLTRTSAQKVGFRQNRLGSLKVHSWLSMQRSILTQPVTRQRKIRAGKKSLPNSLSLHNSMSLGKKKDTLCLMNPECKWGASSLQEVFTLTKGHCFVSDGWSLCSNTRRHI